MYTLARALGAKSSVVGLWTNETVRCSFMTSCVIHANLQDHQKELMKKKLPKRRKIEGVKKVVLVASGKGGVGKSTIAANLAVGLKQVNPSLEISLLDADVFGPSQPRMMNLSESPELDKDNLMIPLQNHGIKCMSMGFLVKEGSPIIWRGLMVMSAIEKLVRGVKWAGTDILVVDMPPGTGDTQLSFAQSVDIDGAVIVTTPQKVALEDALKGYEMFRKTDVNVLGCVINMASYICPSCGSTTKVSPSCNSVLEKAGLEILGEIPYNFAITESCDEGNPIVLSKPNDPQALMIKTIAGNLVKKLNA